VNLEKYSCHAPSFCLFTIFVLQNIAKRGVCIMQSAIVQVRVEPTLKQKADALFKSIGLDTATAIRLFFTQSLLKGNIPFEIATNSITPRKDWAEIFSKAKKKEQLLIPETINNDNFEWEW
jgi:addiction module RelB/DinJ family antitoxin